MATELTRANATANTELHLVLKSLISAFAIAALLAHILLPGLAIDAIGFGLLILAVLPWLSELIASAEFPGGWKVQFRKVMARQDLQQRELATLKFLVSHFLTDAELNHLRRFESSAPFNFIRDGTTDAFKFELRRLRSMGLIRSRTGRNISSMLKQDKGDVKNDYELTQAGKDYLKLLHETQENDLD
ncbi:MAG: hypothetical protein ND866_01770 [Pyrinomonadaceae bacterium]|nr:hypothetical protein [Pyrinomonadaceae bacterium]